MRTIQERFWEKVDKSGGADACWLWKARIDRYGYGVFNIGGKKQKAHRIAYQMTHGTILDGFLVCHNCPNGDNPACVNPAHLFHGTFADNMADMAAKGRSSGGRINASRPGSKNPMAKLTEAQVHDIRERYSDGNITHQQLAREYGVNRRTIGRIISGEYWTVGF